MYVETTQMIQRLSLAVISIVNKLNFDKLTPTPPWNDPSKTKNDPQPHLQHQLEVPKF